MQGELPGDSPEGEPPPIEWPDDVSAQPPVFRANGHDNLPQLWQQWGLQLGGKGGPPLANLSNAAAVLESDPKLNGLVWYDAFLARILTGEPPREWSDHDDIALARYMQRELGLSRTGREIVSQAVIGHAHQHKRNCVTDWLESLVWDNTQRLEHFFVDYFGVDDNEYTRCASRNFWLSMVARAVNPGCKVDNMIVLEGAQGVGKSTAMHIIGGEWFAEQHESATNPKAFAEILQGKLLVEISEMDAFNRAEVNRVKQTVSCSSDRFRASYARYANDHPRTCVFVGTTNRDDWNRDETGARRFWPIACRGSIDLEGIRDARSQLFAEALARIKAGENHWAMPVDGTRAEQQARYQQDAWHGKIAEFLKGRTEATTTEILDGLGLEISRQDKGAQMRVGTVLRLLGWGRDRKRVNGIREYVYKVGTGGDGGDGKTE